MKIVRVDDLEFLAMNALEIGFRQRLGERGK